MIEICRRRAKSRIRFEKPVGQSERCKGFFYPETESVKAPDGELL